MTADTWGWLSRGSWAVALLLCLALAGCSWLIDVDRDQCVRDDDCAAVGLPGRCQRGVCVARETPDDDPSAADCDGGAKCAIPDAGKAADPESGAASCATTGTCAGDKVCFKDQCAIERDIERFICAELSHDETPTVHFEMPVREFVSAMPPKDLVVNACRVSDVSCNDPVLTFTDKDGTGDIALDLPFGFSGYLEARSADALTALWYVTKPLVVPTLAKPLLVVAPSSLALLASVASLSADTSKGLVILEAFDCEQLAVGGVHFEESKKAATPFYIVDGLPNTESNATVCDEANNQAAGGFLNATPGFTIFAARMGIDGPLLGEYNASVRANTVTYLDIHP